MLMVVVVASVLHQLHFRVLHVSYNCSMCRTRNPTDSVDMLGRLPAIPMRTQAAQAGR